MLMRIKGIEKFREKIPVLSGGKIFFLPLYWLVFVALGIFVMRRFDILVAAFQYSGISKAYLSLFPFFGEILTGTVGLLLVYQMWFWRKPLKAKYGPLSYQRIFFIGFAGISLIMSLALNQFFRSLSFPVSFWADSPLKFLVLTPEMYWPSLGGMLLGARIVLAIFFTLFGFTMVFRSLQTFGFDYMAVVYLYFPEESKIQDHEIYSVLRHPAYTSIITIGLGGTLATGTLYAVIFFAVIVAVFCIHIRFIEEKELLERFGASYKGYMKSVPAFLVKPGKIPVLFKFLLQKGE